MDEGTVLSLSIRPSRCLQAFLFLIHTVAILAALHADISIFASLLIVIVLLISLGYQFRIYGFISSGRHIRAADWLANNQWRLYFADARELEIVSWKASLIHPGIVLLRFAEPGRPLGYLMPICFDSISADQHHALRLRLNQFRPQKD